MNANQPLRSATLEVLDCRPELPGHRRVVAPELPQLRRGLVDERERPPLPRQRRNPEHRREHIGPAITSPEQPASSQPSTSCRKSCPT